MHIIQCFGEDSGNSEVYLTGNIANRKAEFGPAAGRAWGYGCILIATNESLGWPRVLRRVNVNVYIRGPDRKYL